MSSYVAIIKKHFHEGESEIENKFTCLEKLCGNGFLDYFCVEFKVSSDQSRSDAKQLLDRMQVQSGCLNPHNFTKVPCMSCLCCARNQDCFLKLQSDFIAFESHVLNTTCWIEVWNVNHDRWKFRDFANPNLNHKYMQMGGFVY